MNAVVYVPIVKAKSNDIAALGDVNPSKRRDIRPLLELAEYDATDNDAILRSFVKRLIRVKWPHPPYVDLYSFMPNAIVADGTNATVDGFRRIAAAGLRVIPTYGFGLNDGIWGDLAAVARQMGVGFCFRVDIDDLDDQAEQTWSEVLERAAQMGFGATAVDIIVDLRFVGDSDLQRLIALTADFLNLQPRRFTPRSITIAGSSALKTVTDVPMNGDSEIVRQELLLWSHVQGNLGPGRPIIFGDYGVVHPDFSQSVRSPNANGKIRYTRGNSIHYFRGSSLYKPTSNFGQYHQLARRVLASEQYRGPQFSVGDQRISECANRIVGPGNLGTWVHVDQNHHIETTVDQIRQAVRALGQGAAANSLLEVLQGA